MGITLVKKMLTIIAATMDGNIKSLCFMLLVFVLFSCSESKRPQTDADGRILKNGQFYDRQEEITGEVYICTGRKSHAYHSTDECYGIKSCKGRIELITIEDARDMGRTPCHYCHK